MAGRSEWSPPRRRRWTEDDGRAMAAAWRASGESRTAFARRHSLDVQRVGRWIARVGAAAPSAPMITFAPLRIVGEEEPRPARRGTGVEIVVGVAVLSVERDFDADHLRRVVAALGGAAC